LSPLPESGTTIDSDFFPFRATLILGRYVVLV